jgi:hypothetical protein
MENSYLEILHFNDVYNVEEPIEKKTTGESLTQIHAGAARFVTAME